MRKEREKINAERKRWTYTSSAARKYSSYSSSLLRFALYKGGEFVRG